MTEDDVARIETELGVRLPAHYRAFVLAYPPSLHEARFEGGQEPASASYLFDDPATVIEANRRVRRPDPFEDGETTWPDDYLIVGMDMPGDIRGAYCVRLTGRSRAVWSFDYESGGDFIRFSPSLAGFERDVLEMIRQSNQSFAGRADPPPDLTT